jgi:hypothetical protein
MPRKTLIPKKYPAISKITTDFIKLNGLTAEKMRQEINTHLRSDGIERDLGNIVEFWAVGYRRPEYWFLVYLNRRHQGTRLGMWAGELLSIYHNEPNQVAQ